MTPTSSLVRQQAANAVTVSRLLLTPLFLMAIWRAGDTMNGWSAPAVYCCVVATDYLDGYVARRLQVASRRGRILDHVADIVFVLSALLTYTALGLVPWWVPAVVAAAFSFYIVDSTRRRDTSTPLLHLRGSRLGHAGGICNYALVGCLAFDQTAGLRLLPGGFLQAFFLFVPLYSGAAILERLRRSASTGRGITTQVRSLKEHATQEEETEQER